MDKTESLKTLTANKPSVVSEHGPDPDAERKEEIKESLHKYQLWLYEKLPLVTKTAFVFMIVLLFCIMPLSRMSLSYTSVWDSIKDWTIAFLSSVRTIGIAMLTLVIADLMKRLFDFAKDRSAPYD